MCLKHPIVPNWFCFALLFILLGALTAAAQTTINSDDYAVPGEAVTVVLGGDIPEEFSVSLQNGDGKALSRAEGFLWKSPTLGTLPVVLLGVPPTAEPGNYIIQIHGMQDGAELFLSKPLIIVEKDFPKQDIRLNKKMERVYKDNSEQKKSEARALWDILNHADFKARYEIRNFLLPIKEGIPTSAYGIQRRYLSPNGVEERKSVHFGSDLWAKKGTEVRSVGRGRVKMARNRILTGNTVIIEHLPGVYTLYYHMKNMDVREGEMVTRGKEIGEIGSTGFATGVHLHWELRIGGVAVDPNQFIDKPLLDTNAIAGKM